MTVIDGYQKTPVVKAVRLISQKPVILEVDHDGGTDRIELNVPLTASNSTKPMSMGVRVTTSRGDVRFGQCTDGPGYAHNTIRAVDYTNDRIAIPYSEATAADFVAGMSMRIYNPDRTAMYRIQESKRQGDRLWLKLNGTALYAQGRVTDVGDGRLILDTRLTYATGNGKWNNFAGYIALK